MLLHTLTTPCPQLLGHDATPGLAGPGRGMLMRSAPETSHAGACRESGGTKERGEHRASRVPALKPGAWAPPGRKHAGRSQSWTPRAAPAPLPRRACALSPRRAAPPQLSARPRYLSSPLAAASGFFRLYKGLRANSALTRVSQLLECSDDIVLISVSFQHPAQIPAVRRSELVFRVQRWLVPSGDNPATQ
ncbi:uncharacterized protein LOC141579349 isoform X2 [Camelus bactrianus]|uniref:Uncharacterized protein LOC141579349 isoform X2 n=1 Tax=Camelus bactrianus TaxID=9837 RepID=A0AC58R888_CAMBA